MSTNFPTSLDSLINPTPTDSELTVSHSTQHSNANDAIEALQAKVGVNSSAVTTSHDYKLSEVTSTDKAVGKTATQTLTNKTLTSAVVNGVTLSTSSGTTNFLRGDGSYAAPVVGDASYAAKGSVQGLTDAATSGLTISSGVISVNSGTGANQIVKLDASAKLPAVDGSQLTNVTASYPFAVSTEVADSYYTAMVPIISTTSTSALGWTATSTTFSTTTITGYHRLSPSSSANLEFSSGVLPGAGSSMTYNISSNKIVRLKMRVAIEDTLDRKGFGFCITPANIHTAQTDTTNGEVRFIMNGSTLYAQNANGTTATSTDISSGVTLTNFNTYEIVFTPGTSALFYVNGTLKATHTTNLPTTGAIVIAYGVNANGRVLNITNPVFSTQV